MSELPERLDLRSMDIAEDRRQALLELLPEVRTEDGKIDFDRLKLALGEAVDVGRERYGLNWPGKADCFKTIQAPSLATLRPCPEESVNFDTTENLIIEGDNLEVLKLLQKSYLGKVKMIYIDPPYNTGKDFIYPDDYSESLRTYLEYTGQVDAEGRKFGTNNDMDGRFHSKWLSMMYPRLYLARNLMAQDGVIFCSINDQELDNLIKIMDEIFGERNFVETYIWHSTFRPDNSSLIYRKNAEFIVCYARAIENLVEFRGATLERTGLPSLTKSSMKESVLEFPARRAVFEIPDGKYFAGNKGGYSLLDDVVVDAGRNIAPFRLRGRMIWGQEKLESELSRGTEVIIKAETFVPYTRKAGDANIRPEKIIPSDKVGDVLSASAELRAMFGADYFDYPKPVSLLRHLVDFRPEHDVVLDFFAGSGTTAQAVLEANRDDGGARRFILVQLPEPVEQSEFQTIAQLMTERVRRVIRKLDDAERGRLPEGTARQDRGFRVFKLAESNFTPWEAARPQDAGELAAQLELHTDHTRHGRSQLDVLAELLLKSGFPLTAKVELLSVEGKSVYSVAGGALLVCLEQELTLELIRAMAKLQPERVLCLDEGFAGNDQLKTNAVLTFRDAGVTAFKTV